MKIEKKINVNPIKTDSVSLNKTPINPLNMALTGVIGPGNFCSDEKNLHQRIIDRMKGGILEQTLNASWKTWLAIAATNSVFWTECATFVQKGQFLHSFLAANFEKENDGILFKMIIEVYFRIKFSYIFFFGTLACMSLAKRVICENKEGTTLLQWLNIPININVRKFLSTLLITLYLVAQSDLVIYAINTVKDLKDLVLLCFASDGIYYNLCDAVVKFFLFYSIGRKIGLFA